MSAFVVDDNTINKIMTWFELESYGHRPTYGAVTRRLKDAGYHLDNEGAGILAHELFDLNVRAVNVRYGDGEAEKFRPLDYQFKGVLPPTLIQAYKALKCLSYQCCEGDVIETKLYKLMKEIENIMAHAIVSGLEAYDKAKWG